MSNIKKFPNISQSLNVIYMKAIKMTNLGEGGKTMTITIFFFTISIKKREISLDEDIHREVVERRMQESAERNFQMMGRY
jgi:uncharacterized protein (TIGR02413 family)